MLKTLQFTTVICHQFIHRNIWDLRPPAIFTFGQFWPFGLRSACDILWRNQWDSWSCAQRPTKLSNSQLVGSIPPPSEKYEFVSWDDDYSQYVESHKSHVPNHQPDKRFTHKGLLCFLFKTQSSPAISSKPAPARVVQKKPGAPFVKTSCRTGGDSYGKIAAVGNFWRKYGRNHRNSGFSLGVVLD